MWDDSTQLWTARINLIHFDVVKAKSKLVMLKLKTHKMRTEGKNGENKRKKEREDRTKKENKEREDNTMKEREDLAKKGREVRTKKEREKRKGEKRKRNKKLKPW